MSGSNGPPVETNSLWQWDTTNPNAPFVIAYYGGSPSKTGLIPQALRNFVGVPLVRFGKPKSILVSDEELFEHIRSAEDQVEQDTGLLLCPTSVASPPCRSGLQSLGAGIIGRAANGGQQQGVDYDLPDAPYDFKFDRSREDGWLVQSYRYRPLRILDGTTTATKQIAYVYPLLNEYFQIPNSWYQEDLDFALLRVVPAVNVTMLPLFALQLAVQGFSNSVPGGIWYQYTAGLTPFDYQSRFRFMKELVLCQAAIVALMGTQGTVNQGLDKSQVLADGVQTMFQYRAGGAYKDLIDNFMKRRDELLHRAIAQVAGPVIEVL